MLKERTAFQAHAGHVTQVNISSDSLDSKILSDHKKPVLGLALFPDKNMLASAYYDSMVKLWMYLRLNINCIRNCNTFLER